MLGRALRDKAPRTASGRTLKVFYVAQTGVAPPTFALVANRAEPLHFSEERRIENLLREAADFTGIADPDSRAGAFGAARAVRTRALKVLPPASRFRIN